MSYPIPEHHPKIAYTTAIQSYDEWNNNRKEPSKLTGEALETKHQELLEGLEFYFEHADSGQYKLIDLTTETVRRALIAEAVIARLTCNSKITDEESLKSEIVDAINLMQAPPEIKTISLPPGLAQRVLADSAELDASTTSEIREMIMDWMIDFPLHDMKRYEPEIDNFRDIRKQQTILANRYQAELIAVRDAYLATSGTDELRLAIQTRLQEVEDFRGGMLAELPRQGSLFKEAFSSEEFNTDLLKDHPHIFDSEGNIRIPDVPDPYRQRVVMEHPTITELKPYQQSLTREVSLASQRSVTYAKDAPNITLNENGIKSWQRTIEKLIYKKGGEWNVMGDLSRINLIFSNADSLYSYNHMLQKIAKRYAWKCKKDGEFTTIKDGKTIKLSGVGDKGIRCTATGATNWNQNILYVGTKEERKAKEQGEANSPVGLFAEMKSDSEATSKVEYLTHPLYEISRIVRSSGDAELTTSQKQQFYTEVYSLLDRVLRNGRNDIPDEYHHKLTHIKEGIENGNFTTEDLLTKVYLFDEAHAAISFSSMQRNSSPSMAAMHAFFFNKRMNELSSSATDLEKDANELEAKGEHVAAKAKTKEATRINKTVKVMSTLFEDYGPRESLEYSKEDYAAQERREEKYQKSYEQGKEV